MVVTQYWAKEFLVKPRERQILTLPEPRWTYQGISGARIQQKDRGAF